MKLPQDISKSELKSALETDLALHLRQLKNLEVFEIGSDEVPDMEFDADEMDIHEGVLVVQRKDNPGSRVFVRVDYELF